MKNKTIKILSSCEDIGKRLDLFLSEKIDHLTRSNIKKLINQKKVTVNNQNIVSQSKKIKEMDQINITLEDNHLDKIKPSNKNIKVIFEDEDIVVVDKPQGMVVHPGAGNKENTLVNILIRKFKKKLSNLSGNQRPGIVHRIDKETSGLLVIAKNNFSHSNLGRQFAEHTIKRKYISLVWGVLRPMKGRIETFITRSKRNRKLMTADEFRGKKAITNYDTIKVFDLKNIPKISLVEFELKTGRTHQIRVHMNFKGTCILGDLKYKKKNISYKKLDKTFEKILNNLNGQLLHASILGFSHPKSSKKIEFSSKLPGKFEKLIKFLDKLKN